MSHKEDMDRAEFLKMLYEKFMSKVDHKKDHKGRAKEAQASMTDKLGPEWKDDADVEGMVFIEVEEDAPQSSSVMSDRLKDYQNRVDDEANKAGMGEAPDAEEYSTEEEGGLMEALKDLLEKHSGRRT